MVTSPPVGPILAHAEPLKAAPLLTPDKSPSSHSSEDPVGVESHMQMMSIPVTRIFSSLFAQLDITALSVAFGECMARSSQFPQLVPHSPNRVHRVDTLGSGTPSMHENPHSTGGSSPLRLELMEDVV